MIMVTNQIIPLVRNVQGRLGKAVLDKQIQTRYISIHKGEDEIQHQLLPLGIRKMLKMLRV